MYLLEPTVNTASCRLCQQICFRCDINFLAKQNRHYQPRPYNIWWHRILVGNKSSFVYSKALKYGASRRIFAKINKNLRILNFLGYLFEYFMFFSFLLLYQFQIRAKISLNEIEASVQTKWPYWKWLLNSILLCLNGWVQILEPTHSHTCSKMHGTCMHQLTAPLSYSSATWWDNSQTQNYI